MNCDICGKEDAIFNAQIEGTMMIVCKSCSSYGEIKGRAVQKTEHVHEEVPEPVKRQRSVPIQIIVENYSSLIKNAREHRNQKQEELAKEINEKESLLHSIESGRITPSNVLARKLEKHLVIKLVQEYNEIEGTTLHGTKNPQMTLGDIAIVRRKKQE